MDVRPSWQNLNGAAQAFSGLLLTIVSSPGCQQAFVDNQAGYGTVPSGATTRCTDCYAVYAVSRCRQHWDIWTIEGLAPDDLGQVRQWNLHVGGSFADVARTNPFYRFIETLFHHRATGGCTATDYRPSSATTREQMPVFMLTAKEGAVPGPFTFDYSPPACAPPNMFNDVPETSPFCRWIEELARRGVVTGCGRFRGHGHVAVRGHEAYSPYNQSLCRAEPDGRHLMEPRACPWLPVLAAGLLVLAPDIVRSQTNAGGEAPADTEKVAQPLGDLFPRALSVDPVGNLILEPGEAVIVAPSWENLTGAPQTFGGLLALAPDPGNCISAVLDGVGDYGTVPDGVTARCMDCYVVSAAASTPRCVHHWDIRTIERLTPGQTKEWLLHVGGSFTDVPTTSPFYRFVETVFHRGVTGGCGATTFCPSGSLSREQMTVFVLVAKEGAGYTPPACTPPNMFDDVPETSPFCRWIEELVRRGTVAGCSTSPPLFCPHDLFAREQMTVLILRTLDPTSNPPACVPGGEMFEDVPASSPFCRWIEEFARRRPSGCSTNPPLFCPHDAVTREQMSVFLSAMFGLTLYGP